MLTNPAKVIQVASSEHDGIISSSTFTKWDNLKPGLSITRSSEDIDAYVTVENDSITILKPLIIVGKFSYTIIDTFFMMPGTHLPGYGTESYVFDKHMYNGTYESYISITQSGAATVYVRDIRVEFVPDSDYVQGYAVYVIE